MAEDPDLDLSDPEESYYTPWLILLAIGIVTAVLSVWLIKANAKQNAVIAAVQQEVNVDRDALDKERDRVFELTRELDALGMKIRGGQVPNKAKAVAQYNALAAEQRAQREKVKAMADKYNEKVQKLHDLQ